MQTRVPRRRGTQSPRARASRAHDRAPGGLQGRVYRHRIASVALGGTPALATIRRHRAGAGRGLSPFVLPSFLFAMLPWLWDSPVALGAGLVAHVVWFAACEVLAPRPSARVPATGGEAARRAAPPAGVPAPAGGARRAAGNPAGPRPGFQTTTVLAVLDEASDIKTLRLARPEGFEFVPGQFVPVRLQIDGKPHVRCYSISSPPHTRGYPRSRCVGRDSCPARCTRRCARGDAGRQPAGGPVRLPVRGRRPDRAGRGRHRHHPAAVDAAACRGLGSTRPITLLYSARHEHDIAFLDELRVLAGRHPQVKIAVTLTQPKEPPRRPRTACAGASARRRRAGAAT